MTSASAPDGPSLDAGATAPTEALVDTTLELLAIASPIGREEALCDHLAERLGRTLPDGHVLRRGNALIARPWAPRGRPVVALVGHLDTVPAEGHVAPERRDDRIVGRGASDMKGGLAVMVELLERLSPDALAVDPLVVLYDREEGPYEDNGLEPLLAEREELRATSLALCLEPTDNRLQLGALGSLHATLTFEGRRAHSGRPWQGRNAVHAAGPMLAELEAREPRRVRFGELDFWETTSVTMVEAVGVRNVVPDRLTLNLNHRFAPDKTVEEAQRDVESLVGDRAHVAWTDLSPSGPVRLDNPLLRPLVEAPEVAVEPKLAWTDVARLGVYGVDAVNFGPGESAQAHQPHESCAVSGLARGYRLLWSYLHAAGR